MPSQNQSSDNQGMATIAFVFALLALPQPDGCTPQFAPLNTGSYSGSSNAPFWRKEDAGAWGGSGWLGWTWKSNTLVPLTLVVRDRRTDGPSEPEVTVETTSDVTFAVRCVRGFQAGTIRSADVVNHRLVSDGPLRVALGDRRYEVRLRSARADLSDATVTLSDGQQTQVLYSADGVVDDPHFDVEWAGDLDRDGRLDLVVNLSRKYSVHPHRLLLSSRAEKNQLVGEGALFESGD